MEALERKRVSVEESSNARREREQKHLRGRTVKEKELPEKLPQTLPYVREDTEVAGRPSVSRDRWSVAQPGCSPLCSVCLRFSSSLP